MPPPARAGRSAAAAIVLASALAHALIAGRAAGRLDTLWDERVDLDIAADLARAPIMGEAAPQDPTQARLPMYVTALAQRLTGRDDLALARAVSVAVGAAGVVATGGLAWSLFGAEVAAWASLLLALAPYYLGFSRIAMTEGDVFVAATVAAACWACVAYARRPASWRWLLLGILYGLAVGAKVHAALLILPFGLVPAGMPSAPASGRVRGRRLWTAVVLSGLAVVVGPCLVQIEPRSGAWVWGVLAAAWTWIVIAALRDDVAALGRWRALAGVVVVGALTWLVWMPEHCTSPGILRGIFGRAVRWDQRAPGVLIADHLRLYSGILWFKATRPVGVLLLGGLAWTIWKARRDPGCRLLASAIMLWLVALCMLPLRQTFYLMGIYPLLMIAAAGFGVGLARKWGGAGTGRVAARAIILLAPTAGMVAGAVRAYPDYQLFPDDVVGTRWLGAEARGYRNLIQTNSDGCEEVVRWCLNNVPAGKRVVSYLWEDHIIRRLLPCALGFEFEPRGISQASDELPPAPAMDRADYVLLHLNNVLGYGDRPPDMPPEDELSRDFSVVHVVRRGRTRMAVAWVLERRSTR